jgi:hypothetical protein
VIISDAENDDPQEHVVIEDYQKHVKTEDKTNEYSDTKDENTECVKAVNDTCPILL